MDVFYVEVSPIIIYPDCLKNGNLQDCYNCFLQKHEKCFSPRGRCVVKYKNHKKGCPNFGKRVSCPPLAPMFDYVFDMSQKIYVIYSIYDLRAHVEKMRARHPLWTDAQLLNVLYWQGSARKALKLNILQFNKIYKKDRFYVTTSPEAMGIDVTQTMKNVGINLEWPARNLVYKIAMAGIPINDEYLNLLI